ncbi:6-phosphogluconate dehydrogenase [Dehalogenimonas formicexedens]|uniref:6-phosphogluconate dehydrogenase n=1 Tax=Dehalogenimonas formicexedens TaxID=1839801 RepID=A0A1P8F5J4_9CHLR|nr:decarboxylating 6-phosphogluconate dehydrogenase [Dehalogenimonas formicexedens]APV43715.1 6-phosphogluconate dehydrogenase [Dehalogenimonas formicexedens]
MELGMIGLGRMGGNMAQRLIKSGHRVVGFDPSTERVKEMVRLGVIGAASISELIDKLVSPRAIWCMVPSGQPTEDTVHELGGLLSPGDTIIDGGNSNYKDSIRRAGNLAEKGISFLDAGTSGGIWGLDEGYSLMVGGDADAYRRIEPVFRSLAPSSEKGVGYVGPSGAGHFVKMVHNGIEYGLMEAYAEGFELLRAKADFNLDLTQIAGIWRYGSVVRSWLLDLVELALKEDPGLKNIRAFVEDSGEGKWTVQESLDLDVPLPVIVAALQVRFRSRQDQPFGNKLLVALRNKFGGHRIKTE